MQPGWWILQLVVQIPEMGLCSVATRRNVFSCFTVIWFSSAVSAAVGGAVELQTMPLELTSRCGDNVTLKCEATVPEQMEIKQFSWVHPNKSCGDREQERKPWCESICEPPRCNLSLTLVNMMPVDQGLYLCKLRSTMGVFYKHSVVTVQDCIESVKTSVNKTHASCCFSGVYPAGVVHWSRGDANLTEASSWQEDPVPDGRYNICSKVGVKRGNMSQPLQCSLWIRSRQMYLVNISEVGGQEPSGRVATLQGVLILLGMVVLILVT